MVRGLLRPMEALVNVRGVPRRNAEAVLVRLTTAAINRRSVVCNYTPRVASHPRALYRWTLRDLLGWPEHAGLSRTCRALQEVRGGLHVQNVGLSEGFQHRYTDSLESDWRPDLHQQEGGTGAKKVEGRWFNFLFFSSVDLFLICYQLNSFFPSQAYSACASNW